MAVKSGTSHALSTFTLMILSGILVTQYHSIYYYSLESLPIMAFICDQGLFVQNIINNAGYSIDSGVIETVIIATILSFIWGVVYQFKNAE